MYDYVGLSCVFWVFGGDVDEVVFMFEDGVWFVYESDRCLFFGFVCVV